MNFFLLLYQAYRLMIRYQHRNLCDHNRHLKLFQLGFFDAKEKNQEFLVLFKLINGDEL